MYRLLVFLLLATWGPLHVDGCTSAIVGSSRSSSHATLLWKHRDTGAKANYIRHHEATDTTLEYIALHNDTDTSGSEAWIGMNRAGFAVMNTAVYNLMPDTATVKDMEGVVMTLALQRCHTVDDFAMLLDTLPRPLGVQANFGVIDAGGNRAFFETDDYGSTRYDAPDSLITVRTNYAHSGGPDNRLGVKRECTARRYFDRRETVTPVEIIDSLSRVYRNTTTGLVIPAEEFSGKEATTGDYIPRTISTASVVIEARPSPQGDGSEYVMWYVLGFPPTGRQESICFNH